MRCINLLLTLTLKVTFMSAREVLILHCSHISSRFTLDIVQVSCQVYSYWDGQARASSVHRSDTSYWVGIKYESVTN